MVANAAFAARRPLVLSIEGNVRRRRPPAHHLETCKIIAPRRPAPQIGVGKSTLLKRLRKQLADNSAVTFVDEPVEIWEEAGLLAAPAPLGLLSEPRDQRVHAVGRAGLVVGG